jgi:hypothetical protein
MTWLAKPGQRGRDRRNARPLAGRRLTDAALLTVFCAKTIVAADQLARECDELRELQS